MARNGLPYACVHSCGTWDQWWAIVVCTSAWFTILKFFETFSLMGSVIEYLSLGSTYFRKLHIQFFKISMPAFIINQSLQFAIYDNECF